MPLTHRADGTGPSFLVNSTWWNDYFDLLTGVMTDQPVSMMYSPGSATSVPTLQLRSNDNAPPLTIKNNAGATLFSVSNSTGLTGAGGWSINGAGQAFFGTVTLNGSIFYANTNTDARIQTAFTGASPLGLTIRAWNGSAAYFPFSIGGQFNSALAWIDKDGSFHGPLGTGTANVNLTYKDQSGFIEFDANAPAASPRGILFAGWDGSALHAGFQVDGGGIASIGTIRNNAATGTVVPIYTGSSTPTGSPPTGAIWIKA